MESLMIRITSVLEMTIDETFGTKEEELIAYVAGCIDDGDPSFDMNKGDITIEAAPADSVISNERLKVLLYNALVCLEETNGHTWDTRDVGITYNEYVEVMGFPPRNTYIEDSIADMLEQEGHGKL